MDDRAPDPDAGELAASQHVRVELSAGHDLDDVAALLRIAADQIDMLGNVRVERAQLAWVQDKAGEEPVLEMVVRSYRQPTEDRGFGGVMDIPIRDAAGYVVGHRSRGDQGTVG